MSEFSKNGRKVDASEQLFKDIGQRHPAYVFPIAPYPTCKPNDWYPNLLINRAPPFIPGPKLHPSLRKAPPPPPPLDRLAPKHFPVVLESAFGGKFKFPHTGTCRDNGSQIDLVNSGITSAEHRALYRERVRARRARETKRRGPALRRNILKGYSSMNNCSIATAKYELPINQQWTRRNILKKKTPLEDYDWDLKGRSTFCYFRSK